jgi:hypothetical protein
MIDLDVYSIDFECPRCKFYNSATLKQVRLRDVLICRGCKSLINLEDHMNEVRKAIRSITKSINHLETTFQRIGESTRR